MEAFLKFLAVSAGAAVLSMTVRSAHKEMGAVFSLLCGAALLLMLTDKLSGAAAAFSDMAQLSEIGTEQMQQILKVLGIAMLSEFAAQACRDAGEEGIALRVEMGGRVMLMLLSLPVLREITQVIAGMTK